MVDVSNTDLPRWRAVRAALDEFRRYLSADTPSFEIIAANDSWWDNDEYYRLRPESFPTRMRGVYLMFDEHEELLWVGKAMVNFDKRVWAHDKKLEAQGAERRWTDVIHLNSSPANRQRGSPDYPACGEFSALLALSLRCGAI